MARRILTSILALVALIISTSANAAQINDGWYKIYSLRSPHRVLDVGGAQTHPGANIQLWDWANVPQQKFYVKNLGNGYFTLRAGHCNLNVAAANASRQFRTNVQLANPNQNDATQQWRAVPAGNGSYYIESRLQNKLALDCADTGNSNGTNIWLWEYGDVEWNKWVFESLGAQTTQRPALQTVPAYTNSALTQRNGNERVDKGDMVTVLQETNNSYYVRYPVSNGTKDRWVSKDIFIDNPVPAKLQNLINTWNNRTWRDHTYLPSVKQCKEFASYIFNQMYGVGYIGGGSVSSNPKNYLINLNNPNRVKLRDYKTNLTAASAQQLFSNAQPGDFIQIRRRHGGAHSGIFVNRTSNGIVLFEANADGKNSIRTNTYSYSDLATKNFAMSIYYAL